MTVPAPALGEVEVLFFDVGGQRFGVDAVQVLRIDRPREDAARSTPLGSTPAGGRALVFATASGEAQLVVERVHGVRAVPVRQLRRMPQTAIARGYAIGVWLDGSQIVPLVDLVEMWKLHPTG